MCDIPFLCISKTCYSMKYNVLKFQSFNNNKNPITNANLDFQVLKIFNFLSINSNLKQSLCELIFWKHKEDKLCWVLRMKGCRKHNLVKKEFSPGEKSTKEIITIVCKHYERRRTSWKALVFWEHRGALTQRGTGTLVRSQDSKGCEGSHPNGGDMPAELTLNWFNDQ